MFNIVCLHLSLYHCITLGTILSCNMFVSISTRVEQKSNVFTYYCK